MCSLPEAKAVRYLWIVVSVTALTLISIGGLNIFVDPFGVFGTVRCVGWVNDVPDFSGFDRMTKPYELLQVQPRTVLFGSSTARAGFCGLAEGEVNLPQPAYNGALLGANAHEIRLSIEQAVREAPVKVVVIVADFFAFNVNYPDNERFEPKRLAAATRHKWPGMLPADFAAFTIGCDAFRSSWQTLSGNRSAERNEAISNAGAGVPWHEHFRTCERSYLTKWFPPPMRKYEFSSENSTREPFADFDASLQLCVEHSIRVIVLCPPIHARFHEALAVAGVWPQYEFWKRELARKVRITQKRSGNPNALALWDFSLFNEMTREPVPDHGEGPMHYFSDSAHFTPKLGALVLGEILGTLPVDSQRLGVRLDQVEMEAHLASVRAGLEFFRANEPRVIVDVRSALADAFDIVLSPRP